MISDTPWNIPIKVETRMSGDFTFCAGVDLDVLAPLIQRIEDASTFLDKSPIYPETAARLGQIALVSGIHATNKIEGGIQSVEEVERILTISPAAIKTDSHRKVSNLGKAFGFAALAKKFTVEEQKSSGRPKLLLAEAMFTNLHRHISDGLKDSRRRNNLPGVYRDKPLGFDAKEGDSTPDGASVAPKCWDDVALLMEKLISWGNSEPIINLPAVARAPLVRYHLERIAPFSDGNGMTGRLIESMILRAAGFAYADILLCDYYNVNLERYTALSNECRNLEIEGEQYPNTPLVRFAIEGIRHSITYTYDLASEIVAGQLYISSASALRDGNRINDRQHVIVSTLFKQGEAEFTINEIRSLPWYRNLYNKRTYATQIRDLNSLMAIGLIEVDFHSGVLKLKIRPRQ